MEEEALKQLSQTIWLLPFGFIWVFYALEEKARKEKFMEKVHMIMEKKVRHNHTAPHGNDTICKPALKVLIEEEQSKSIFELYYYHYPRIVEYLHFLQRRRIALFVASAFPLFIGMLLLTHIPETALPRERRETIEWIISSVGFIILCIFAVFMWYRRFIPIRTFCDELDKIQDQD